MPWIIVSLIRLLIPLVIFKYRFWGIILAIIFADTLDVVYLDWMGVSDFSLYNHMDKLFDTYMYLIIGYVVYKNWKNVIAKNTALALLAYRFIGAFLYLFIANRALLLIFPNVFLTYVIVYEFFLTVIKKDMVKSWKSNLILLVIITIPKLIQEYLFHVVQIPLYQWMRAIFPFI